MAERPAVTRYERAVEHALHEGAGFPRSRRRAHPIVGWIALAAFAWVAFALVTVAVYYAAALAGRVIFS